MVAPLYAVVPGAVAQAADLNQYRDVYRGGAVFDAVLGYGADPTGVVDATTILQEAADAALAAGGTFTASGTFKCSATIAIRCNFDLRTAIFNYTDTTIDPAVLVGNASAYTRDIYGFLPKVFQLGKAGLGGGVWGSDVGIRALNIKDSKLFGQPPQGFSTGYDVRGQGRGNADNLYTAFHGDNCKIGLHLSTDTDGWANSNTFVQGHLGTNVSTEGTEVAGSRQLLIDDACNNNVFLGYNFEGNGPEYHAEIYGRQNYLIACRWETVPPIVPKVKFSEISSSRFALGNVIWHGWSAENIVVTEDTHTKGYNQLISRNRMRLGGSGSSSGNIVLTNQSGGGNPAITVLEALDGLSADASALYGLAVGMLYAKGKARADTDFRWRFSNATGRLDWAAGDGVITSSILPPGSVAPETNVSGNPGSIYCRTNGELYFKQTGVLKTGWKRLDELTIAQADVEDLVVDLAGKAPLGAGALRRSGALVETMSRKDATTNALTVLASGSLYMVSVEMGVGTACSSITFVSGATAYFPGGPTAHQLFGLYDDSRNLLASSADVADEAWAANSEKTLALVGAPFTTTYSGLYYLGVMIDAAGGTVPNLVASNPSTASAVVALLDPALWGQTGTGLTALPDPASTFTSRSAIAYGYVS